MQTAHASRLEWGQVSGHRSGTIDFKRLLKGTPREPDNFELSLVRTGGDYFTPRHRHNFDQVRLCLDGTMNYAPDRDLPQGAVGYFPEGTFYGPQRDTIGSILLLLQMGGAGGYGFMSYDELGEGYRRLSDLGQFERGVFTREDPNGRSLNKDGYEAVWEHVNGRAVEYPPPRYEEPIVMHPDSFGWVAAGDGFESKRLGSFGERGLALGFIRGPRGARHRLARLAAPELMFVIGGAIRSEPGGEMLAAQSACHLDSSDEGTVFEVSDDVVLFFVRLPRFDAPAGSAA
jgi:hypothetical protein